MDRLQRKPSNVSRNQQSAKLIAKGFNVIKDKSISTSIFSLETKINQYGILVPEMAYTNAMVQSETYFDMYNSKEELMGKRIREMGLVMKVSVLHFNPQLRSRLNYVDLSATSKSSQTRECKVTKAYYYPYDAKSYAIHKPHRYDKSG